MVQPCGEKENDRITKMVYVRECACSRSVGLPLKRLIDTVKDCYKKKVYISVKENRA